MIRPFFPILNQLAHYDRDTLRNDLAAGLTVGVMLIPQGMAYALLAGVPPIYGLYAALIPLVAYAFFGTSRQLAVGPTALASLLTASAVAPLAGGNIERYVTLVVLLALMVGLMQIGLGLARAGFLANFLSHPVLSGFTSAAAFIIGFSQLRHVLGINLPRSDHIHEMVQALADTITQVHGPTLFIGLGTLVLLYGFRRWKTSFPGALVVVGLGTLAVWGLGLTEQGVQIVGDVPGGLPLPTWPSVRLSDIQMLAPGALTILVIGFIETMAVAKVYAARNGYEINPDKELLALGVSKLVGSFFQAFPTTGGFSRTAVNAEAGARTQVAALVTASLIALTLLFLTPLFHFLPKAVLGAIIIVAVTGLVDVRAARQLWHTDRADLALMVLTFIATLTLGIETGILVGVVASLLKVLRESAVPHTALEGRLPDTATYRNLKNHPTALSREGVVVFRMDASLYFANAAFFKDKVREIVRRDPALQTLVLDLFPVNRIDSTALTALRDVVEELHENDVCVYLAAVKKPVMQKLEKAGLIDFLGFDHVFLEVHDAARQAEAERDQPTSPIILVPA